MAQIEKRIIVTDSIERIFNYVAETVAAPEIWPGLIGVNEIHKTARGAHTRQLYTVTGVLVNDGNEPAGHMVDSDSLAHRPGGFELVMEWVYQREAGAPCIILNADYTLWSLS